MTMKSGSPEEGISAFLSSTFNPENLKQHKEVVAISGAVCVLILICLVVLATWFHRRRKRFHEDETENGKTMRRAMTPQRSCDGASQSPRSSRPRSHSWKTPPQSRKEFPGLPPILGGLTDGGRGAGGAPLFDPAQLENILKNYTLSLPSYRGRLESIEDEGSRSEDEEAPGQYEGPGKVSLRLAYNSEVLLVHVINCKGLPAHCVWTSRGPQYFRRNPFVRVTLLPDTNVKNETFDTKERHRTLNPKFDEAFEFAVASHELHERAIKIAVYDREEGRSPKMVGMVVHPLDGVSGCEPQTADDEAGTIVLDLSRHESASKEEPEAMQRRGSSPGDISVGLTCNPLSSRIRINVLNMKGFRTPRDIRLSGAYVRVQLYHGHHLLKTKTTNVYRIPRDVSDEVPVFESFNFGIPGKFFDSVSLSLTVVAAKIPQENVPSRDLVLGNIILGPAMFARGDALSHWEEMMASPGAMISKWHQLEDPSGFRAKHLLKRSRSLDY